MGSTPIRSTYFPGTIGIMEALTKKLQERLAHLLTLKQQNYWADPTSPSYSKGWDAAADSEIAFLIDLVGIQKENIFSTITVKMGEECFSLVADTGKTLTIPVEFTQLFALFVEKIKRKVAGERVSYSLLNQAVGTEGIIATEKLRKFKHSLNSLMKNWGDPLDKKDWILRSTHGYALNPSCTFKFK